MQDIKASVGEGAVNGISDVCLVQAILQKTLTPASRGLPLPYLAACDGNCGRKTIAAIRAFQADQVLVTRDGLRSAPNSRAMAGVIRPGDATWEKLLEKVNPAYRDLRILPGGRTVYLAATPQQLATKLAAAARATFAPAFRAKVNACINRMHTGFGIAIGVCPDGDRRTFATQYGLLASGRNVTRAGPGESNHNFGMAVDLGFEGLRWIKENGDVVLSETAWLHLLEAGSAAEALKFWQALRTVGTGSDMFRGPEADRPHLQNWNDSGVDMAARLAALLNRAGRMRWRGANQAYACDLGFGGECYAVGSAREIWSGQAAVTVAMLVQARIAQAQRIPLLVGAGGGSPPAAPRVQPVTQADVTAMQQALRREFELADENWARWTAS